MEKTDHLERMASRARQDRRDRQALREWLERMAHGVRLAQQDRPVLLGRLGCRDQLVRKENPGLRVPRGPKGTRVRRPKPARKATQVRS